jgi:hypothetical protein
MRYELVLAIGWLLVSISSAAPQDKPAPLPQESFVGEWVGDNKDGVGLVFTRFVVSKKDNDWSIKAWFNNGGGIGVPGSEAPLPKVTLSLLGDPGMSKARPYGLATWELKGGKTIHMTLRSEKDKLVVETFQIHKDKLVELPNIRSLDKYKKK